MVKKLGNRNVEVLTAILHCKGGVMKSRAEKRLDQKERDLFNEEIEDCDSEECADVTE